MRPHRKHTNNNFNNNAGRPTWASSLRSPSSPPPPPPSSPPPPPPSSPPPPPPPSSLHSCLPTHLPSRHGGECAPSQLLSPPAPLTYAAAVTGRGLKITPSTSAPAPQRQVAPNLVNISTSNPYNILALNPPQVPLPPPVVYTNPLPPRPVYTRPFTTPPVSIPSRPLRPVSNNPLPPPPVYTRPHPAPPVSTTPRPLRPVSTNSVSTPRPLPGVSYTFSPRNKAQQGHAPLDPSNPTPPTSSSHPTSSRSSGATPPGPFDFTPAVQTLRSPPTQRPPSASYALPSPLALLPPNLSDHAPASDASANVTGDAPDIGGKKRRRRHRRKRKGQDDSSVFLPEAVEALKVEAARPSTQAGPSNAREFPLTSDVAPDLLGAVHDEEDHSDYAEYDDDDATDDTEDGMSEAVPKRRRRRRRRPELDRERKRKRQSARNRAHYEGLARARWITVAREAAERGRVMSLAREAAREAALVSEARSEILDAALGDDMDLEVSCETGEAKVGLPVGSATRPTSTGQTAARVRGPVTAANVAASSDIAATHQDAEDGLDPLAAWLIKKEEQRRKFRRLSSFKSIKQALEWCIRKDRKEALAYFEGPPPAASRETLLEEYPFMASLPPTKEVKEWLRGNRPAFYPSDDLLHSSTVHPQVQKLLNLQDRLLATWVSPDLRDQVHVVAGTTEMASFPHHGPDNVRLVPFAYNNVKGGNLDEVALLILLCVIEANQPDAQPEDPDRIAGLLNAVAHLNTASCNRRTLSDEDKKRVLAEVNNFRSWLWDGEADFDWKSPLPPADIETAIGMYRRSTSATSRREKVISALLEQGPGMEAGTMPRNSDRVPTLFFGQDTTTEQIAHLLCVAVHRMRYDCGKRHDLRPDDDELGLYRFWLRVAREQGYMRADGTVGVRDVATGLPLVFGSPRHPLSVSMAAHSSHGQPFALSGSESNAVFELWILNRFRRSWRTSTLLGLCETLLPPIQRLRDVLVERGVLAERRVLQAPGPRLESVWWRNNVSSLELQIEDPGRVERLEAELEEYFGRLIRSGTGCVRCGKKTLKKMNVCSSCHCRQLPVDQARFAAKVLEEIGGGRAAEDLVVVAPPSAAPLAAHPGSSHKVCAGIESSGEVLPPVPKFKRQCGFCGTTSTSLWYQAPGKTSLCRSCHGKAAACKFTDKSDIPITNPQQQLGSWGCLCRCGCSRGREPGAAGEVRPTKGRSICGGCFKRWFDQRKGEHIDWTGFRRRSPAADNDADDSNEVDSGSDGDAAEVRRRKAGTRTARRRVNTVEMGIGSEDEDEDEDDEDLFDWIDGLAPGRRDDSEESEAEDSGVGTSDEDNMLLADVADSDNDSDSSLETGPAPTEEQIVMAAATFSRRAASANARRAISQQMSQLAMALSAEQPSAGPSSAQRRKRAKR